MNKLEIGLIYILHSPMIVFMKQSDSLFERIIIEENTILTFLGSEYVKITSETIEYPKFLWNGKIVYCNQRDWWIDDNLDVVK